MDFERLPEDLRGLLLSFASTRALTLLSLTCRTYPLSSVWKYKQSFDFLHVHSTEEEFGCQTLARSEQVGAIRLLRLRCLGVIDPSSLMQACTSTLSKLPQMINLTYLDVSVPSAQTLSTLTLLSELKRLKYLNIVTSLPTGIAPPMSQILVSLGPKLATFALLGRMNPSEMFELVDCISQHTGNLTSLTLHSTADNSWSTLIPRRASPILPEELSKIATMVSANPGLQMFSFYIPWSIDSVWHDFIGTNDWKIAQSRIEGELGLPLGNFRLNSCSLWLTMVEPRLLSLVDAKELFSLCHSHRHRVEDRASDLHILILSRKSPQMGTPAEIDWLVQQLQDLIDDFALYKPQDVKYVRFCLSVAQKRPPLRNVVTEMVKAAVEKDNWVFAALIPHQLTDQSISLCLSLTQETEWIQSKRPLVNVPEIGKMSHREILYVFPTLKPFDLVSVYK